jgi:hypothetical protein
MLSEQEGFLLVKHPARCGAGSLGGPTTSHRVLFHLNSSALAPINGHESGRT